MARRNIYFKEKTEREVHELVQLELQNGATHGEINFSSVVNELVGIGLMVKNIRVKAVNSMRKVLTGTLYVKFPEAGRGSAP